MLGYMTHKAAHQEIHHLVSQGKTLTFSSDLNFSIIAGVANRLCFNNGTWSSEISTTCCTRVVFNDLLEDVSLPTDTFKVNLTYAHLN